MKKVAAALVVIFLTFSSVWAAFLIRAWKNDKHDRLTIHLLDQPELKESLLDGCISITNATASSPPIFRGLDFVAYDFQRHQFAVSPRALMRFAGQVNPSPVFRAGNSLRIDTSSIPDQPFILKANGSPIYIGVFAGRNSSFKYAAPVAKPDQLSFGIGECGTFTLVIQKPATKGGDMDPRSDPRVLDAIKALGLPKKAPKS
jgi:hypothetical protein